MLPSHIRKQDYHQIMIYLGIMYRESKWKNERYSMYEVHEDTCHYVNLEVAYEFDQILEYLNPCEREIILNDYFLPIQVYWWKKKYSKDAYKCFKSKAIATFLDCLYA